MRTQIIGIWGDTLQLGTSGPRLNEATIPHEACQYVATNSVSSLASITLDGSPTPVAGDRALLPIPGTYVGPCVFDGATWAMDPNFVVRVAKVAVTNTSSGPVEYWQTAASGTAVFELVFQTTQSRESHDENKDGSFEFTYRKAFYTTLNVGYDIVIPQATWLGNLGATDATLYHLSATIEVEIQGVTTAYTDYKLTYVGIIYKGTYGGTATWAISQGLGENSALRVPTLFNPESYGACNISIGLSGTNNGDLTFTYTPTGGGNAPGGYVTKIRILGGGRYAT